MRTAGGTCYAYLKLVLNLKDIHTSTTVTVPCKLVIRCGRKKNNTQSKICNNWIKQRGS